MKSSSLILIMISVGLFYTFIDPQYQKVKEARAEAGEFKEMLKNVSEIARTREDLEVKHREIPKEEIEKLEKVLPDNSDIVKLALDLDAIASNYGIAIKKIQVGEKEVDDTATFIEQPTAAATYERETVSFGFVTSYDNFKNFVNDIEKSLRIIDIQSASFQVGEEGSNLYEYKLTIGTYWLK